MNKRIEIFIMHKQIFIIPTIGFITDCYGYYKCRIGFGWLNFRISIGFKKYEYDLSEER